MNEYVFDLGMETTFLTLKEWKTPQRKKKQVAIKTLLHISHIMHIFDMKCILTINKLDKKSTFF